MRPGSAPSLVNPVMLFQQATCTNLQLSSGTHKHSIKGSLSKDGKVCWMYSGSILEVVATETQNRLAAWNFGIMLHDSEVVIQSVAEFWAGDSLRLLVGLKNTSIAGLVCVLNVNLSRVVKAIEIPFKVTSIECITSLLGNDFPVWAFSEHLSCFYGIVAVGTEGGHVYLIDMCLDTHDQSDEMFPNTLHFISPDTEDVVQTRHEALSQRQVLCMELGMDSFSLGSFNYHSNDESIMKQFKTDEICVTCLKYMSRNGLLAVGYNFGCFQLWRLSAPILEYSSRLDDSGNVPITHIAYQEPENDPKNFSYLWVARGPLTYSSEEGYLANITLYQLSFNKRMWYSSKECFYEEMSTIGIRLEHDLSCEPSNSPSSKMTSSNVISCYTLEDPYFFPPVRSIDDSHEETSCNPDLSLCVFVWRADNGSKSGTTSYHLAIFDMNRWYHAQMPSNIRTLGSTGICPYMAFCCLDEIIDNTLPDELLCAHINPSTVRKFISDPGLIQEQLFYPSSLQFDVFCLMESGLVNARYLGMQRQVLSTIQKLGPSSLIDPNELYKMCLFVGLAHRSHDAATPAFSLTNYNREAILSLCLEHHLVNVITKSVEQWADGEYLPQGCTLKFLLDWTWNKVVQIKQCVDNTCKPFYDWSGLPVDERCVQILHHCLQKLFYLTHILQKFIHTSAPITENGIEELCQKFDAVQLLSHHLKAVIWFVESGLLPENDELASYIPGLYRYPRTSLIEVFMKRREELQQLHSDVKASELLMIDGLIENTASAVRDLWQQDGGDGQYPPPSINALINFYLLDDVPLLIKHCVISYFLLDLASLEDDSNVKLSEKVNTFADVFSVPSDTMNLITGFWLLDHKDFEVAFSFLVNSPVFGPWQHKQVIKALLYQNEGKLALRYLAVKQPPLSSPEEVKLKLTTFLVNGMTAQAVEFQRTCCDQNNAQDLISHIFLGCQQTKTMDQLLKLPLTELEEKWLENYLLTSMESQSEELLVMYYLQRARFVDAIRLNERLKTKAFGVMSAKDRERASTRNTIVNGCAKLLPEVQRQLIFEPAVLPRKINRVPRPKPLSTMVTKSHPSKLISQSTFVLAVMEKMQEVAQIEADTSNGSFDDFRQRQVEPFISTPITPKKRTPLSDLSKVVYERNLVDEQKAGLRLSPSNTPPMAANLFAYGEVNNKRPSGYVSAEALSVLQTPVIQRKNTPRSHVTSPRPTPQSILKVRQISNKSPNMHGTSPLSIRDKDVPQPRSALRSAKLNLSLNDSTGTPLGASAKKTKLLRFAEPAQDSSPVSSQDSPTPSSSHAFPIVTARSSLSERKSLSELIAAESCPASETVVDDDSSEMDAEMMEAEDDNNEKEEKVVVRTEEDIVEERTSYMVTDIKEEDISDEISNSVETEADENKEEDVEEEEEEEAMEGVEEDLLPVTYVDPQVQGLAGSMHFQPAGVSEEDIGIVKNTMMLTEEEPEVLVCKDQTVVIPDYLTPSEPIDLTEEEEEEDEEEEEVAAEEFKPFESTDILELAPLGQKSELSQVEDYNSNRNVDRLLLHEEQEMESEQLYDQYMEEDVPEDRDEMIESERRDDVQIITEPVLSVTQHISQEFNEATSVNNAANKDVDIVEVEGGDDDEDEVVVVEEIIEEEEDKEEVVEEVEEEKELEEELVEEEEELVVEEEEKEVEVEEEEKEVEVEEEEKEVEVEAEEEKEVEAEEKELEVEAEEKKLEVEAEEKELEVEEEEEELEVEEEEKELEVEEEEKELEAEEEEKELEAEEEEKEPEASEEEELEVGEEEKELEVEEEVEVEEQEKELEVEEEERELEVEEEQEAEERELEVEEEREAEERELEVEEEQEAEERELEVEEEREAEERELEVEVEEEKEVEDDAQETKAVEEEVELIEKEGMEEEKRLEVEVEQKEAEVVEEQEQSEMVEEQKETEMLEEPKETEMVEVEEQKEIEEVVVEGKNEAEVLEEEKEIEMVEAEEKGIEMVEAEENRTEMVDEQEEETIKLIVMEEIPEVRGGEITISKPSTINDSTPELAHLTVPPSPSHSASTRNSSRSASPRSTASSSPILTRRSLRSKKVKAESKEANRSEPTPVPAMTKSISEQISMAVDIAVDTLSESTGDKVVSRLGPSKSTERRSTRKKTTQKSLKSKLESVKKDLEEAANLRSDFSEKSWLEEDQTMTELVPPSRGTAKVLVKTEAISSSEMSKQEEEEDKSLIKTRSLRSSRSVTRTRKSSRLKTEPPSPDTTSTQSSPPHEVGRSRGTTPPREVGRTRGTTPPREVGRTRGTTPPREVGRSRGTTPPRGVGRSRGTTPPRETTPLRVLPVRAATPTRGEQSAKVSDERSSSPILVNIKIEPQDESKVGMEETVAESEPTVRTTRRTTRKTALKSQSQLTTNTESDGNDIDSPVLHIKPDVDMSETPPNQQKPFVFAPPITRKKGQRKESAKKDVKTEDSSVIFFSTRSQHTALKKEPFTEPEPEEMTLDVPMEESLESPTTSSKKTVKTRSTRKKVYLVKTTDSPIVNLLTPSRHKTEPEEKETTRTAQSRILRKPAHSMVLRTKTAVKKRKL